MKKDEDQTDAARVRRAEQMERRERVTALIVEEMKALTWTPKTSKRKQEEYAERFEVDLRTVRKWSHEASLKLRATMQALDNPTSVMMGKVEFIQDTKALQEMCIDRGQMTPAVETQKLIGRVLGHDMPETVVAINIGDRTVDVKAKEAVRAVELARQYFELYAPEHIEPFREFVEKGMTK